MAARADPIAERAQLVLPRLGGPQTAEDAVPFERRAAQCALTECPGVGIPRARHRSPKRSPEPCVPASQAVAACSSFQSNPSLPGDLP